LSSKQDLPVVTIVNIGLRFSVFVDRSFRRHDVLATVDVADIRGLATARLLCVAELPSHSRRRRYSNLAVGQPLIDADRV
jgi:hypothetical protein